MPLNFSPRIIFAIVMQFPFSYQIKIMKAQFWSYLIYKYLHIYHNNICTLSIHCMPDMVSCFILCNYYRNVIITPIQLINLLYIRR